ncbi:MAG: hypothetical protein ABH954_03485 [Candidatus Omnitrophota bacterium]
MIETAKTANSWEGYPFDTAKTQRIDFTLLRNVLRFSDKGRGFDD